VRFFLIALVATAGCSFEIPSGRFKCDAEHACPPGQECVSGVCFGSCPALQPPENGSLSSTTGLPDQTVTYDCAWGYVLVGDSTRTCLENLTWSGTAPTCVLDDGCPAEPPVCDFAAELNIPSDCPGNPGTGDTVVIRATSIAFPGIDDGIGFDLDCFDTSAADSFGCGKPDSSGGIDNQFSALVEGLGQFGIQVNDVIAGGLGDGSIWWTFTIEGYNGLPDDPCVAIVQDFRGYSHVDPFPGKVEGGVLKAYAWTFLNIPITFPPETWDLRFGVSRARIELPLTGDGVSGGVIGGLVPLGQGFDDLTSIIQVLEAAYGLSSDLLTQSVESELDMYVPGVSDDTCACDAVSIAIRFDGVFD
jgi:hypothetical protein